MLPAVVPRHDQGRLTNREIAGQLQNALSSWRYKRFLRDGKTIPVCFLLSFPVMVKGV